MSALLLPAVLPKAKPRRVRPAVRVGSVETPFAIAQAANAPLTPGLSVRCRKGSLSRSRLLAIWSAALAHAGHSRGKAHIEERARGLVPSGGGDRVGWLRNLRHPSHPGHGQPGEVPVPVFVILEIATTLPAVHGRRAEVPSWIRRR